MCVFNFKNKLLAISFCFYFLINIIRGPESCKYVAASGAGAAAVAAVVLLAKSRGPRTPSDDKSLLTDYSTVGTYCRHSLAPSGTATRPTNQPAASNKSTSVSSK